MLDIAGNAAFSDVLPEQCATYVTLSWDHWNSSVTVFIYLEVYKMALRKGFQTELRQDLDYLPPA